MHPMLSFYNIRVSLVLIGGSAAVSVSLCRVCYDAFCTMTSDGRRWSTQHWIHELMNAVFFLLFVIPFLCYYVFEMSDFYWVKEICSYFHNKSWGWVSAEGKGWVMKHFTAVTMLHCRPLLVRKYTDFRSPKGSLINFLYQLIILYCT